MSQDQSKGNEAPIRRRRKRNKPAWITSGFLIIVMALRVVVSILKPYARTVGPPATPQDQAEAAVSTFFDLLAAQRYAEAASYFGGDYNELAAAHPEDAADYAALWEDACTLDGYQCLSVESVNAVQEIDSQTFEITVEFAGADGVHLPQTAFPFTVGRVNGRYLVQSLPIQGP